MPPIFFKERKTGEIKKELVYGEGALSLLYANNFFSRALATLVSKPLLFSRLYGLFQRSPFSKRKIIPFIKKYGINSEEFATDVSHFFSFNDFFIRKLKSSARPLAKTPAVIPADGRFLFYPEIDKREGFVIKGQKFSLEKLLGNREMAVGYAKGSMVIGRLAPSDYHRFHFPCDATPTPARLINGPLYSVNPVAIKKNISLLAENKRMVTELNTDHFGKVIYIEIGATNVGSINQTFSPYSHYKKGDEKGFFAFGGSSLILLFPPHSIIFDSDLLHTSLEHQEIRCLMGESMGTTERKI